VVADGSGIADLLDAIAQNCTYLWNLIRWVSPRAIEESFVPPRDWRDPFLVSDPAEERAANGRASRGRAGSLARS
jgi:hypothetical protein